MNDYPQLWKRGLIQARIRELAGHRCEHCGMQFHEGTNKAICDQRRDGHAMVGTVHHIDHDKANCTWRNLVYLCQRCHLYVQYRWKPGEQLPKGWHNIAPDWITKRGLPYTRYPYKSFINSELTRKECKRGD